jgi:hypothetical protein
LVSILVAPSLAERRSDDILLKEDGVGMDKPGVESGHDPPTRAPDRASRRQANDRSGRRSERDGRLVVIRFGGNVATLEDA